MKWKREKKRNKDNDVEPVLFRSQYTRPTDENRTRIENFSKILPFKTTIFSG